jgi:hypothetical protein
MVCEDMIVILFLLFKHNSNPTSQVIATLKSSSLAKGM